MKTLYIKNLIAVLFLALVYVACNKSEEEDCNINVVIEDGKLISPKWMAHLADSLINTIPRLELSVSYFEFQQQTYIFFDCC